MAYSFDNDDSVAADRHRYLATMLDGFTRQRLAGLGDLTGWRCLELGAGGGSVAHWLATRVGPTGTVLATDLNTRHIPPRSGFAVLRHDLVAEPIPTGPWDLIHSRLVLLHIPQRREVLARLAAALAPGGVLVVEDWATALGNLVLATPDDESGALVEAYHRTLVTDVLPANGNDPTWAPSVHAAMLAAGLVDVDTAIEARSWPGGTAGALMIAANVAQLRPRFLAAGFTDHELDRLCRLVTDPRLVVRGHFTYSTAGRRPVG